MQPFVQEGRPAYVMFERRAVENRTKSIEKGHYVAEDVDFAIITPPGSKDRTERQVNEWFDMLKQQVTEERYPAEWLKHYRTAYDLWKEGQEIPLDGTPIAQWGAVSPAQVKNCLACHVRTVEDLAIANEDVIAALGMGGRDLQTRARTYLETAKSFGATSEVINGLRQQVEDANKREAEAMTLVGQLEKRLTQLEQQSVQRTSTPTKG